MGEKFCYAPCTYVLLQYFAEVTKLRQCSTLLVCFRDRQYYSSRLWLFNEAKLIYFKAMLWQISNYESTSCNMEFRPCVLRTKC